MRVMLEFEVKENSLQADYRRLIVAWLKNLLTKVNKGKYYDKYYDNTKQKPYTFSVIFHNPIFKEDRIYFEGKTIKVLFSMLDQKMEGYIMNMAFLQMRNVTFNLPNGNFMKLINVNKIKESIVTKDRAMFRTAPGGVVLVKEHNRETNKDKFYTVEDENYEEKLTEYLKNQCEMAGFNLEEVEEITVNSVEGKKVVVRNYDVLIDGVVGYFDISAPTYILQYFSTLGLGGKRSLGFGTVNLV